MAKVVEQVVVIKFSKLVKEKENDANDIAGTDVLNALEQVAQELVDSSIIVEVYKE